MNKISNLILVLILINLSNIVYSQKGFAGIDFSKVPKKEDVNKISNDVAFALTMTLSTHNCYLVANSGKWYVYKKYSKKYSKNISTSSNNMKKLRIISRKNKSLTKFINDNIDRVKKVSMEAINHWGTKRRIILTYYKKNNKFYFTKNSKHNILRCSKIFNKIGNKKEPMNGQFRISYTYSEKKYTAYDKYSKDKYCRYTTKQEIVDYDTIAKLESLPKYKTKGLYNTALKLKFPKCKSKYQYLQVKLRKNDKNLTTMCRKTGQKGPIKLSAFIPSVLDSWTRYLTLRCHN